ncbi:MAG: tetratricopeptide repeat protein [Longimicrobiales bacterium]|nr:tetratricopeptide repeat protein [Longimicrobiales bacterium]
MLPRWQRRLLAVCVGLAFLTVANTLYLVIVRVADASATRSAGGLPTDLPLLLQVMVLSHTGLGILLVGLVLLFVALHLPKVWRARARPSLVSGSVALAASTFLLITGLFILTDAASEANRWAWWLHVTAAATLPVAYLAHRRAGVARIPRRATRRFALGVGAFAVILVALHLHELRTPPPQRATRNGESAREGTADASIAGAPERFSPPGLASVSSPFFPSSTTTASGGRIDAALLVPDGSLEAEAEVAAEVAARGFVADRPIGATGCARCHADIVEQWKASAHRFSSFNNPFYVAAVQELRTSTGGENKWIARHARAVGGAVPGAGLVRSRWCAGCHDPAVLLTGEIDAPVRQEGVTTQAGLTCMACHAISRVHGVTGNGNYVLDDGAADPYLFADAPGGTMRAFLHDAALRARPATHTALLSKPVFSRGEYCATCHKVSLPEAVNNYRWLRGQNEYDAWHDSGISGNAAGSFYLSASRRVCQDCHMPLEPAPLGDLAADGGHVRSHRFVAANTALPHLRGDTAMIRRTEAFLREGKLRVEIFALRERPAAGPRGAAGDEEVVMAIDEGAPRLEPGKTVEFDVVVRNLGVGHAFPGGTTDANEAWIEFTLLGADGSVIAQSGRLDSEGRLDPMAHRYGAVFLDAGGEPVLRRNSSDIRATAALHVIPPGTADVGHYVVRVPDGAAGGVLTLRARLLWRKFNRDFTTFAWSAHREGFGEFPEVPDLPVTEIARDDVALRIATPDSKGAFTPNPGREGARAEDAEGVPRWMRYNDYGIALLLEGNTRLARVAFQEVAAAAPERIDGPLNLARTALAAGDLETAYRHLETVEALEAGHGQAAWVWGRLLQEDGRYDEAELAYRRVLEEFPSDRNAWRNLGRVLYLAGRSDEAIDAFDAVLAIDPEDRIGHYFRMLALRVAGRREEADAAEAAFKYHRIDESARALARRYLAEDPGVNLMAQPIHTHHLESRR